MILHNERLNVVNERQNIDVWLVAFLLNTILEPSCST